MAPRAIPERMCAGCSSAASASCPRCALPLCPLHRPGPAARCAECEASFRRRRPARMLGHALVLLVSSAAAVLVLGFLILVTGGGALGVAPMVLASAYVVILHALERRARARFLADRRPTPLARARLIG